MTDRMAGRTESERLEFEVEDASNTDHKANGSVTIAVGANLADRQALSGRIVQETVGKLARVEAGLMEVVFVRIRLGDMPPLLFAALALPNEPRPRIRRTTDADRTLALQLLRGVPRSAEGALTLLGFSVPTAAAVAS